LNAESNPDTGKKAKGKMSVDKSEILPEDAAPTNSGESVVINAQDSADKANDAEVELCEKDADWEAHFSRAKMARASYQADASLDLSADYSIRSVDMQKVIMLPRIPGNKTAVFTRRIIAFHETFAVVGKPKKNSDKKHICVLWHEGIAGRKAEEVVSAFAVAMKQERDVKHKYFGWIIALDKTRTGASLQHW